MPTEIFKIAEDEGLVNIKPHSNDVFCIVSGELHYFFERELLPKQSLLIIGKLYDQWHVEDILKPAGELERDGMSDVYTAGTWTAASVEEEPLTTLMAVEYSIKVSVAEEKSPSQPAMRSMSGDLFKSVQ